MGEIIQRLFNQQAMMFLMIFVGAFLAWRGIITLQIRKGMTDIVIQIVLPCNIICAFISADASSLSGMLTIVIMGIVTQGVLLIISQFLWRSYPLDKQCVMRYSFQYSNAGFLGSPVVEGIYGSQGLLYATIYLIPVRFFLWTAGVACYDKGGTKENPVKKMITHPCVVAVLIGLLFMFLPVKWPGVVTGIMQSFSRCLTPMTMMIIGSMLLDADWKHIISKDVLLITFLRIIVLPLIALGACKLIGVETLVAQVVVMLVSMPVASTSAILAQKYNKDALLATNCVVFSTLVSMITIPLIDMITVAVL